MKFLHKACPFFVLASQPCFIKKSPNGRNLMVAGVGLEPTTFRVWTERSSQLSYPAI